MPLLYLYTVAGPNCNGSGTDLLIVAMSRMWTRLGSTFVERWEDQRGVLPTKSLNSAFSFPPLSSTLPLPLPFSLNIPFPFSWEDIEQVVNHVKNSNTFQAVERLERKEGCQLGLPHPRSGGESIGTTTTTTM